MLKDNVYFKLQCNNSMPKSSVITLLPLQIRCQVNFFITCSKSLEQISAYVIGFVPNSLNCNWVQKAIYVVCPLLDSQAIYIPKKEKHMDVVSPLLCVCA